MEYFRGSTDKVTRPNMQEISTETVKPVEHTALTDAEQSAWRHVLGAEIEIRPPPNYVTPEVRDSFERLGFGLRYVPEVNLGSLSELRRKGVERYLSDLQERYPNWRPYESLSPTESENHLVVRNIGHWYWEQIKDGEIKPPKLSGQWLAVELIRKPNKGENYQTTPYGRKVESLEYRDLSPYRFPSPEPRQLLGRTISYYDAEDAIYGAEPTVLAITGVPSEKAMSRQLTVEEWNLLANREGWGDTNSYEWTSTIYGIADAQVVIGSSLEGGAASVQLADPRNPITSTAWLGFRAAIVLGSGE